MSHFERYLAHYILGGYGLGQEKVKAHPGRAAMIIPMDVIAQWPPEVRADLEASPYYQGVLTWRGKEHIGVWLSSTYHNPADKTRPRGAYRIEGMPWVAPRAVAVELKGE